MNEEIELSDEFDKRPIKPLKNLNEPGVWFKKIWLLNAFEKGLEKTNILRQFKCRQGLNILWSKPEQFDENTGLYGDGVSGHSTGKTLFCRILRCLLGEEELGPDDIKQRLKDEFGAPWVIAEVRLNEKNWVIGRPLTGGLSNSFAEQTDEINSIFASEKRESYDVFLDELNTTQANKLNALVNDKPWLHLLECLARDQEARFSSMVKWRDASAGSTALQMNNQGRHSLLRLIIGALDPEEYKLREQVTAHEKELETGRESFIRAQADEISKREAIKTLLQGIENYDLDLENLEVAKDGLESAIEVRQDALKDKAEYGRTAETDSAENNYNEANKKVTKAENRIAQLEAIIPTKKRELEAKNETVERVLTSGVKDPKRSANDYCPHTRIEAITIKKCLTATEADAESLKELAQLQAEEKQIETEIQTLEKEQSDLKTALPNLTETKKNLFTAFKKQERSDLGELAKLQQIIPQLKSLKTAIVNTQNSVKALEEKQQKRQDSEIFIKESKDKIKIMREGQTFNLRYISDIISDIIKAFLGKKIQGKLLLNDSGLAVSAANKTNLSGAALANIKTLAFDLAMLVQGIEGKSEHPRFLIHDGPREGDMARVIYERFFLYILKLEDAFNTEAPNFQYFVTTTTPPPEKMRDANSEYLICSPLSGESESSKLLGKSF